jgi:hypothetical protein
VSGAVTGAAAGAAGTAFLTAAGVVLVSDAFAAAAAAVACVAVAERAAPAVSDGVAKATPPTMADSGIVRQMTVTVRARCGCLGARCRGGALACECIMAPVG